MVTPAPTRAYDPSVALRPTIPCMVAPIPTVAFLPILAPEPINAFRLKAAHRDETTHVVFKLTRFPNNSRYRERVTPVSVGKGNLSVARSSNFNALYFIKSIKGVSNPGAAVRPIRIFNLRKLVRTLGCISANCSAHQ
jgi:hypothetical protein